ncbi:unnamed protein product [Penicillium salamii]|uniref:F-box domain-containing protein n=1 Tax=Penicillium salamii TaxID=1612424 RepID=A0A9W4JRJ3_9EURO|nr:unnamed protein product [Penicillium salamii]
MELLKYLFNPHLDLPQRTMSHKSYCIDRLTRLPEELLIVICRQLSPVDIVSLSLCNHRLHTLFCNYYQFPTLRSDRLSIFIRLEKDLPEYFACDVCNFLHRYDGSESFGPSGLVHHRSSQLPCVRKGYQWKAEFIGGSSTSLRTHQDFAHSAHRVSFLHIKLAMRRYWYGPRSGINTDCLAFTQVLERPHPWQELGLSSSLCQNIRFLFSIEAQIWPEPLGVHIRMQDIVLFDLWEDSKTEVPPMSHPMWSYEICRHTPLDPKAAEIESVYNGDSSSFPFTCTKCNTVSLVEFRRIDCRLALVMTRWINVGAGIHRDDPLWKFHAYKCNYEPRTHRDNLLWRLRARYSMDGMMPDELSSSLMLQSPRVCFERTASLSFQDLRSRNISYLRGDRYKKGQPFTYEQKPDFWHISYK